MKPGDRVIAVISARTMDGIGKLVKDRIYYVEKMEPLIGIMGVKLKDHYGIWLVDKEVKKVSPDHSFKNGLTARLTELFRELDGCPEIEKEQEKTFKLDADF